MRKPITFYSSPERSYVPKTVMLKPLNITEGVWHGDDGFRPNPELDAPRRDDGPSQRAPTHKCRVRSGLHAHQRVSESLENLKKISKR